MKRLLAFDIAKAICIILVVVGHYSPDTSPHWYMFIHNVIYSFHMPLFMFASGYIYLATIKDTKYIKFLQRKIKRLMIPYFVTSFLIITIKLITEHNAYVENPVTLMSYLQVFWSPSAGYFLWFIWTLWWMFMIIPFFKTKRSRLFLLFIGLLIYFIPYNVTKTFCLSEFKSMLVFFMLGVICVDYKQYISFTKYKLSGVIIFTMLYGIAHFHLLYDYSMIQNFMIACFGILMIIQISYWLEKRITSFHIGWLMSVSSSSYIIYLFHTTFEGFAKSVLHKIPIMVDGTNEVLFTLGALMIIITGVIIPVLLYRYVLSKSKLSKFMFGIK